MKIDSPKKILLVEDDPIVAMVGKKTLAKYGYNVLHASSGEMAVDAFASHQDIDLVLMDIDLGYGVDGTEAAALILDQRDIPVVFLSSHTEPDIVEKTEKITSYGYVVKNSGSTILFASIKRAFKLFEADNRYRSLFGNNHTVMLIVDPVDGRIRDVNQAACDFYGWPRETLLSMKVSQIDTLSPDEIRIEMARAVAEKRKNYLATSPTITYSVRLHEGHDHWQWVSENAGPILGYTEEEIMRPDWWFDNLHPVDRPRVLSAVAKLSDDNSLSLEYRFLRKNRTFLWLRDQKRWTTSIGGDLEIVGSLTDISECKTIEDELIQKSIALESTANPMIITGIGGEIEWVNKAFMRFTGYSQDETIGKNPKELLGSGEQSTDFYRNMWGVILSGNTWRGQIVNRKKNGELRTEEMTVTPVPDQTGHISHCIAEWSDITERIGVENELHKFERLLKATLESPKDMNILSVDTDFRYLCFNSCHRNTMLKSYGIDIKPGMSILECITDDDDRRKAERSFGRAFTGESYIVLEEYGVLERILYETRYNPTFDDKQRIIGTTAFSTMKEKNI